MLQIYFITIIIIIIMFYCSCGVRGDGDGVVVVVFVSGIKLTKWLLLRSLLEVICGLYRGWVRSCEYRNENPCSMTSLKLPASQEGS
jgi:hypothetical protein